jgi:ABC-2 type transport system permease protein
MGTIWRHALARTWGQVLGWGLSLGLLSAYLMSFYDTLIEQQSPLRDLMASYPPELLAFFGDFDSFFTPEGFLNFELFSYLPLIVGIYAVLAGSGLLSADEESGTLDLLLAHPISRAALFAGRVLGFVTALFGILVLTWLGLAAGKAWSALPFTVLELSQPFVSLGAVLLLFGALALLLSQLLPSRRMAATLAGLALVASFFLTTLARLDEQLADWVWLSPLHYYQGGDALLQLNGNWAAGLFGAALILAALAGWRFDRRDIRVAGEGGWHLGRGRPNRRAPA